MTIRMCVRLCSAAILAVGLPLVGCTDEAQSSAPVAVQVSAEKPGQPGPLLPPAELLQAVARAYREAPALTDEIQLQLTSQRGSMEDTAAVALGPGTEAELQIDGYIMSAAGGQFTIQRADNPGKYYQRGLGDNIVGAYKAISNGMVIPAPQVVMRYAEPGSQVTRDAFGLSRATNLSPTAVNRTQRDGHTYDEIDFTADGGVTVKARVDAHTRFIDRIEVKSPAMTLTATMKPRKLDRLPRSLEVDVAGMRRVQSIAQLNQLIKGDMAPDFTLPTLDGETVTLSDQKGAIVVLDFWATWCGPCKMGLPKLQELQKWADEVNLPLRVLPIDMGERKPTNDEKHRLVSTFWKGQGFTMPTLMDYDNKVARAYRVGPIPHTVVVGPDGLIHDVSVGFNPAHAEHIKEMARKTFREGA